MSKGKHCEAQIVAALKQVEAGRTAEDVAQVTTATRTPVSRSPLQTAVQPIRPACPIRTASASIRRAPKGHGWSSLPSVKRSKPRPPPTTTSSSAKKETQKQGADYFEARYYMSTIGRFMTPDWADKPEAVPYSDLTNPQSLNLYGYVNNNPLSKADKDGHDPTDAYGILGGLEVVAPEATPLILGAAAAVAIYHNRDTISQGTQSLASSIAHLFGKSRSSAPAKSGDKPSTLVPVAYAG